MSFTMGDDPIIDARLIPFDIIGSIAHVRGLEKIGVLCGGDANSLCKTLQAIYSEWKIGQFTLGAGDEDVHTALERELTEKLGENGKKVHTGRSRNDQVLTAMRLFMKSSLLDLMDSLASLSLSALDEGKKYSKVMMPGYTHARRAMPSTLAFWYASFAEGFSDVLSSGMALYERLDSSPLGAAAGFGVPLPLDREYTAKLMGFGRAQVNAAAIQNSRGRLECAFTGWLLDAGRDVEKMAWDLMMYSTAEYGFVKLPEMFCTGSSIMPQKKNADVLELLRALPSVIRACRDEIENIIAKLPSGYHRDFQLTKAPLMRGIDHAGSMLAIFAKLFPKLEWNEERMRDACSTEIFAAHRATALAKSGIPFREAYEKTARELSDGNTSEWPKNPEEIIEGLSHLGAPGNPGFKEIGAVLDSHVEWIKKTRHVLKSAWDDILVCC